MKKHSLGFELCTILIVSLCVCLALYWDQARYDILDSAQVAEIIEGTGIKFYIDKAISDDDGVVIQGWAFEEGVSTGYFDSAIVLKCVDTNDYYQIATSFEKRPDVTSFFDDDECNYDNSGFFARSTQDFPAGEYRIFIRYNIHSEDILQDTDTIINI